MVVLVSSINKDDWAVGVWRLHRATGAMVGRPSSTFVGGEKRLRCDWDDGVSPAPTDQDIADAAAAEAAEKSTASTNADLAKTQLLNNAALIRSAMDGVPEARAALDASIPIDMTNQTTIVNSLVQRQAAVLFLASNALRASMVLAKNKSLPREIINAFLET